MKPTHDIASLFLSGAYGSEPDFGSDEDVARLNYRNRQTILEDILAVITPAEWEALESGASSLPVSGFNRSTLLRLRDLEAVDGSVPIEQVERLRALLERYLQEQLPDKPDARRFIIASCIGLTFVLHEPMHPVESTGIRFRVSDGAATYYCPLREGGEDSLCELCVCRPMDEWEQRVQQAISSCAAKHGDVAARISRAAFDAGFLECGELTTSALEFHDSVRRACEGNSCGV